MNAPTLISIALSLLLLGFDPLVFAVVAPVTTLYAILLHADVPWTFGPLRHVLASPVFHRWHHSSEPEARDKNFAGFLPLWDHLFGTFYMPAVDRPIAVGTPNDPVPAGFWKQLVYRFRKARAGERLAGRVAA